MARRAKYYLGMKNRDYWHQRMLDRDKKSKLTEDKTVKKLAYAYHDSYMQISKELDSFYNKYAIEHNLTYAEATKLLTPVEMREYGRKVQEIKTTISSY